MGRVVTVRPPQKTSTVIATTSDCAARAIREIPTCAHQCLTSLNPKYGYKGLDDLVCQCASFEPIAVEVAPCLREACSCQEFGLVYPATEKGEILWQGNTSENHYLC